MPHEETEQEVLTVLEPFPNLKEPKPKLIQLGFESNLDSDALRNKLPKDFAKKNGNNKEDFAAKDYTGDIRKTTGKYSSIQSSGSSGSTTFVTISSLAFPGTDEVGSFAPVDSVKAVAKVNDAVKTGEVRLFDSTNSNVIAASAPFNNTVLAIIDLGAVSNLPTAPAIFDIQIRSVAGATVNIESLVLIW